MLNLTKGSGRSIGDEVEGTSGDQAPTRLRERRFGEEDRAVREVLGVDRWFSREIHGVVAEVEAHRHEAVTPLIKQGQRCVGPLLR
eukprot:11544283-Heterocapsa_arctica.AAC.1